MYLKPLLLPKAHILVLEDDAVQRAGLCGILGDAGYTFAEDAIAGDAAGPIDLVLAVSRGRAKPEAALDVLYCTAPVILLVDRCAWSGFDFLDAANAFGATAVLQRPFSRMALLSLIARVLAAPAQAAPADADDGDLPEVAELLQRREDPSLA